MEELLWIGTGVTGVLVLTAAIVGWWQHRIRINEMQRRLLWSEQSRFALERHAQEVDLRLAAMAQALQILQAPHPPHSPHPPHAPHATQGPQPSQGRQMPPTLPPDDASERRRFMEEALGRADAAAAFTLAQAGSAHANPWRDTEPLGFGDPTYAPTMPMELHHQDRALPQQRQGRTHAEAAGTARTAKALVKP